MSGSREHKRRRILNADYKRGNAASLLNGELSLIGNGRTRNLRGRGKYAIYHFGR